MSKSKEKEELDKYISKEGLTDTYPLLIFQIKMCEARSHLIRETAESLKVLNASNISSSKKTDTIIKIQAIQLDLISKLFMFMEDYLSYSYYLYTSRNELPTKILSHTNVVWDEIKHLNGLDKQGIYDYLLLPDADKLPLYDNDKQFVKEVLSNFADDIYRRIKEIINFYQNYDRIYIKYKHIFSPLIGTRYKDEQKGIEIPRIFIRDMQKDKITKNKIISTYILSTDNETFDYYEKMGNDISTVFLSLLDCHVHSVQNCGRAFLILDIHFASIEKENRWKEIVRKVNTFTGISPITLRINVKETISQQMLEALSKDHIFKWDQDILKHSENSLRIDTLLKK
jgi:hypothetical protein